MQEGPVSFVISIPQLLKSLRGFINTQHAGEFRFPRRCNQIYVTLYRRRARKAVISPPSNPVDFLSSSQLRTMMDGTGNIQENYINKKEKKLSVRSFPLIKGV